MSMGVKYLMCVAGGAVLGYFYAYGRLERDFQKRLADETYEIRDHYRLRYEAKAKQTEEEPVESDPGEILRQMYVGAPAKPEVDTTEATPMAEKGVAQGDLAVAEAESIALEKLGSVAVRNLVLDEIIDAQGHRIEKRESQRLGEESNAQTDALIKDHGLIEAASKSPVVNYNKISTPPKAEPVKPEEDGPDEAGIEIEFIKKGDFVADQFGYKQYSFTYFAGDDVLANESDDPVSGPNRVLSVGEEALRKLRLGLVEMEGENTIYVRNRTGGWEFEIIRSEGKYSDEVGAESG